MITTNVSYHFAVVFFPWKHPYPVKGASNVESLPPITYTTGSQQPSGITSVNYTRNKGPGSVMNIEFTGYINEEAKITVGTWCLLSTHSSHPMADFETVRDQGMVRFIGQVHEINVDYSVIPESGRIARKITMTVREWCHVLHCPVRYHSTSEEGNLTKLGTASSVAENNQKKADIIRRIGTSIVNVFQQPALSLAWVGGLNSKSDELLDQFKNLTSKDLSLFPKVTARLPALPTELTNFVFQNSTDIYTGTPKTAWSEGFFTLLSGVQKWSSAGKYSFFGKGVNPDEKAKRPMSIAVLDFFNSGDSLFEIIMKQVMGGGGVEVFPDLWYTKAIDNSWKPRPVLVVRDVPFTLKKQKSAYPWTVYDDLPRLSIGSEHITRISLKQTAQNTATIVQLIPSSGDWTKIASAAQIAFYGTSIMAEGQERFGAQSRTSAIRDIFMVEGDPVGDDDISAYENEADSVTKIKEKIGSGSLKVDATAWFNELRLKHQQWYGADYLYPACTLLLKDNGQPFSVGINVSFNVPSGINCVGHCESISQTFVIDASGRVINNTQIQLSRLCIEGASKDLEPMAYSTLVNLLRRDNQGLTAALENKVEQVAQDTVSNVTVDIMAALEESKTKKTENDNTVKKKTEDGRKVIKDKAPTAKASASLKAADDKRAKRTQKT